MVHCSFYIVWTRLFLKIHINKNIHPIIMQHICAYKLAPTYKMTLMYFLVNIHINNQFTLYKVNGVVVEHVGKEVIMNTLTPKTEFMFHSERAKSKWVNTRVVVSKIYYDHKKTWSKKQLRFGSKWISKLTTSIDSIVWPVFRITKKIENASIFLAKMTSIFYNMLLYIIWDPPPLVL
jgi:hypothetical protein